MPEFPFSCRLRQRSRCVLIFSIALSLSAIWVPSADAAVFIVNQYYVDDDHPFDFSDANPGDGVAENFPGTGVASFRACIEEANAFAGPDTIIFESQGRIIKPTRQLPALSDALGGTTIIADQTISLEGDWKQQDFAPNGVEMHGLIMISPGNKIDGLTVSKFSEGGVVFLGPNATNNTLTNCRIGVNPKPVDPEQQITFGDQDQGNYTYGVLLLSGANNNAIGPNNLISGNGDIVSPPTPANLSKRAGFGIFLSGTGTNTNRIFANFIGTNRHGLDRLPNSHAGIMITGGASNNSIGGATEAERNIISSNGNNPNGAPDNFAGGFIFEFGYGIIVEGPVSTGNTVEGNFIGVDIDGDLTQTPEFSEVDVGNYAGGVYVRGGALNTIVRDNVISKNGTASLWLSESRTGILIEDFGTTGTLVVGNLIGTDVTGTRRLGNNDHGIAISFGSARNTIGGTTVAERNILSANGFRGINITDNGTDENVVQGNYIGLDITGTVDIGNDDSGVAIGFGPKGNLIGGEAAGARNVIAGNRDDGVVIFSSGSNNNIIQGNYIGTNAGGTRAIPNDVMGVFIVGQASNNLVGGRTAAARNIISGNGDDGVRITNSGTTGNRVEGNYIGVAANGSSPLGNSDRGVLVVTGASGNFIGGDAPEAGNVIAFSGLDGVEINGANTRANRISHNSIHRNTLKGIAHTFDGNDLIPAPVLTGLGPIRGTTSPNALVEFFADDENEGQDFVTSTTADSSGNFEVSADLSAHRGRFLTATATSSGGSTSQFSNTLFIDPPALSGVLTDITVVEGDPFSLSGISATGAPPLLFQWQFAADGANFADLPDANGFSGTSTEKLDQSAAKLTDRGSYRLVVSNGVGQAVSSAATVTVIAAGISSIAVNTIQDVLDAPNLSSFAHLIANAGADGKTSLRELLTAANNMAGPNTINFGVSGIIHIDAALGGLPGLDDATGPTTINGVDGLVIDGIDLEGAIDGLAISTADNVVKKLNLVNFPDDGIAIDGPAANRNIIRGCRIGNNGTVARPNGDDGILIMGGASNNIVGGTRAEDRNVLSGNGDDGIKIVGPGTTGNVILGNYIGSDFTGRIPVANAEDGVVLQDGAFGNIIGGTVAGARNVISGNRDDGISLFGDGTTGNTIQGNYIGVDSRGDSFLGNGGGGIVLASGAADNLIGGTAAGAVNRIGWNADNGIVIGGSSSVRNTIRRNSVFKNNGQGIRLSGGANDAIEAPVITGLNPIRGTAPANASVEIFLNRPGDAQGETFVVSVNAGGAGTFSRNFDLSLNIGENLTATATDSNGNTSEFGPPIVVDLDPPVITLNGAATMELECQQDTYQEFGATALDDADGDITNKIVVTILHGGVPVNAIDTSATTEYIVRYDVTDISGKSAVTVERRVIIRDRTAPVITMVGMTEVAVECAGVYVDAGAIAGDECAGDLTANLATVNSVNTQVPGTYAVTYNVTDPAGNPAAGITRTVRVADTTPPVITLQGASPLTQTVNTPFNDPGATVLDACDGAIAGLLVDTSGLNIGVPGTYTVQYTASDASGNTQRVSRTVIVTDNVAPVIALIGAANLPVDCGLPFVDPGVTAFDNFDGDISGRVTVSGQVNSATPGQYALTYNVSDAAGNSAPSVTRQVMVRDIRGPVIQRLGAASISVACGSDYIDAGAVATDACEGDATARIVTVNRVNTAVPGVYTITYNAEDSLGNEGVQVTRIVRVLECPAPCEDQCANEPNPIDLDGDGLTACEEDCLGTDAALMDTDGDGIPDGAEVELGLNPLVDDAERDKDLDAINNRNEFFRGSSPTDSNDPERTVYVSPNGQDAATAGTVDLPFQTLSFALSRLAPASVAPARIVLFSGTYNESFTMKPFLTIAGALDSAVRIVGNVIGAGDSALENLELASEAKAGALLRMNGVAMGVNRVAFLGEANRTSTGIEVTGLSPSASVITDCLFQNLDTGVDIHGAVPLIRRCLFEDLARNGVRIRASALLDGTNSLGDANNPATGWNAFLFTINGAAVSNETGANALMEQNGWDSTLAEEIRDFIFGPADFTPFLGAGGAEEVAALYVVVVDAVSGVRVEDATVGFIENPAVSVTANKNGVYALPAIKAGAYTVTTTGSGYQSDSQTVSVGEGRSATVLVFLDPIVRKKPFRILGCGEGDGFGGGVADWAVVATMVTLLTFAARRRQTKHGY